MKDTTKHTSLPHRMVFEKVIRVKIKNLTQDDWNASIDDED